MTVNGLNAQVLLAILSCFEIINRSGSVAEQIVYHSLPSKTTNFTKALWYTSFLILVKLISKTFKMSVGENPRLAHFAPSTSNSGFKMVCCAFCSLRFKMAEQASFVGNLTWMNFWKRLLNALSERKWPVFSHFHNNLGARGSYE